MAEWSIAAVLKTVDLKGSGGSNPSLSARRSKLAERLAFLFLFFSRLKYIVKSWNLSRPPVR